MSSFANSSRLNIEIWFLTALNEWRSGSNQQKHKEDLSEDDRHL